MTGIPKTVTRAGKVYHKYLSAEYSSKSYAQKKARYVRAGGKFGCLVKKVQGRAPGNLGTETLYVLYWRKK